MPINQKLYNKLVEIEHRRKIDAKKAREQMVVNESLEQIPEPPKLSPPSRTARMTAMFSETRQKAMSEIQEYNASWERPLVVQKLGDSINRFLEDNFSEGEMINFVYENFDDSHEETPSENMEDSGSESGSDFFADDDMISFVSKHFDGPPELDERRFYA